jgi:hypothetical protein
MARAAPLPAGCAHFRPDAPRGAGRAAWCRPAGHDRPRGAQGQKYCAKKIISLDSKKFLFGDLHVS